ncbi:hypothetical protein V8E54_010056 [Elaphomyces granulatus]
MPALQSLESLTTKLRRIGEAILRGTYILRSSIQALFDDERAIQGGKDARHLWLELREWREWREWRGDDPDGYFGDSLGLEEDEGTWC